MVIYEQFLTLPVNAFVIFAIIRYGEGKNATAFVGDCVPVVTLVASSLSAFVLFHK